MKPEAKSFIEGSAAELVSLRRNGILSAAEVVINGLCLFLIYRNVADILGVAMLGVWGLILSTTAFGRAADLGISGGLSRFIARALAEGKRALAVLYVRVGVCFAGIAMGGVVLALWWPLWWGLEIALHGPELDAAREVLPWAILSVWLLMMKSTMDSCLIGVGRADLRAVAGIAGMLLQVVASLMLVGEYGLNGLAWAQAAQFLFAILLEVGFLFVAMRKVDGAKAGQAWFSFSLFREMLGFGLALQAGTFGTLMFEPVVKTAIGATAGTYVLGLFEIAYRATYQVKNVVTMALQPTIPVLTGLVVQRGGELRQFFKRLLRTTSIITMVTMIGTALASPIISWLFLGGVDYLLIVTIAIMCVTWATTTLAAPSYYLGIASGRVWPYVLGEFLAVGVAAVLVLAFGQSSYLWLSVLGVLAGKAVGSAMPAIYNRPERSLNSSAVADPSVIWALATICVACGIVATLGLVS